MSGGGGSGLSQDTVVKRKLSCFYLYSSHYRGADKSLARPNRKQARKHDTDERDFNNIETRAVIKFFFILQCQVPFWEKH